MTAFSFSVTVTIMCPSISILYGASPQLLSNYIAAKSSKVKSKSALKTCCYNHFHHPLEFLMIVLFSLLPWLAREI
jgi:hypothetical protein